MADYDTSVGVQLYDDFSKIQSELPKLIAKLNELKTVLGTISGIKIDSRQIANMTSQVNKLVSNLNGIKDIKNVFNEMNKSLNGINSTNIKSMREEIAKLKQQYKSYIDTLNKNNGTSIKNSNIQNKTPYNSTLNANDLYGTKNQNIISYIRQMNEGISSIDKNARNTKRSISDMFSIGKMYFFFNYAKQMFRGLGNIITSAMDFTETENYFARAMGNMYDRAMEFQNKLTEMYGMSANTMMNAQASYKNMIGSLGGLSDEMAYKLSETVTKMTLDFSSLYNVDFESATQKFQSALSKQVRPIRSTSGYDITQSVLGATASSLGIDRSISQMNELEKRLLVILTLMQQMRNSGAMNDFSRTIEQPANQLRILQEQLQEVGRWIGSVFYGTIGAILPYVNGFVMAIKELVKTFALFVGFEIPDSSGTTGTILDNYGDSIDNINSGISSAGANTDKATKKAKEWKNVLMGFDVANVLPDQSSSDSGSSGSGGAGGTGGMSVDPRILDALNKYKYLFDDIHMKAIDIRNELLKWADIAGKAINENIFKPIQNSWKKYGPSTIKNWKDSFDDLQHIASGVFDVVGNKWKPFFSSASDLFFSLLDTASLVTSTVTSFFRNVWDSGGNYFLEGIFDLSTSFIKLATAINDEFIKPVVSGFKNTFGVVLGKILGTVLGMLGKFMTALSKLVTWISKNTTAVKLLGTALTTAFTVIQIGKISQLWNSMSNGLSITQKLTRLFVEHTKIGEKLFLAYADGSGKFNILKNAWNSGLGVVRNFLTNLSNMINKTDLAVVSTDALTTSTTSMTLAQKLCATATGVLQTALSFLAAHPLVAVGLAVGTVVTGLMAFSTAQGNAKRSIEDCSEEIQQQYEDFKSLSEGIDSAKDSMQSQIDDTNVQVELIQKYIDKLHEMEDEDGYVKNIESAKTLISEINGILPDTVSITEDGKVAWQKSNEQIQKSIELLKQQAKQQAYQEVYIESLKAQIQQEQKLNEAKEKLNDLYEQAEASYNEYLESFENGTRRYDEQKLSYDEYIESLKNGNTELSDQITLVNEMQGEFDKTSQSVSYYSDKLDEAVESIGQTTEATKEMSASTEKAYENIGKSGQKEIGKVISSLKDYDKKIDETGKKQEKNSDKQIKTYQKERSLKLLELTKMADDYGLTYDQIIDLAQSKGIDLSEQEQSTMKAILEVYKNGGKNAGDNYIDRLTQEINNGKSDTINSAVSNVNSANSAISKLPLSIKSVVESATSKAKTVVSNAQKNIGNINIKSTVKEAANAKTAGKNAGKSFKNGFSSVLSTIQTTINGVTSLIGSIRLFASGGFPDVGQMFIAREAGPELVGTMNGRTAVANNYQIENGIYRAVRQAMLEGKAYEKGGDLYITIQNEDGSKIEKVIKNYNEYMKHTGGKGGFII